MYGLVNRAVEELICRDYGAATWERVRAEAGLSVEGFISNSAYPDQITYDLVGAACKVLDQSAHRFLMAFGEYWVTHTALESYGALMRGVGHDVPEFLTKLPHLHSRIQLIFPELSPPQFSCSEIGSHSMHVHYSTARPAGLEPFVEGLIHGIGKMFDTPMQVELVADRREGADHSIFLVRWGTPA